MDLSTVAKAVDCLRFYTQPFDVRLFLYDILVPILGILIIPFNLVTVISSGLIIHNGQKPRSTYIFLGNLALSDLLAGLSIELGQYYPKKYFGEITCAIYMGMAVSSSLASVYSVGLIGVDRYLYILHGLKYDRYIYTNRARFLVLITWILSLLIGFLPAMGIRGDTDNGKICWFIIVTPPTLVLVTVVIGIIPLIVIMVLYCLILREALKKIAKVKKAKINRSETNEENLGILRGGQEVKNSSLSVIEDTAASIPVRDNEEILTRKQGLFRYLRRKSTTIKTSVTPAVYNPSKWKAFKIVLFTTGSYLITWGPFFVASSVFAILCNPDQSPKYCNDLRVAIASPLAILAYCNSLLNPLIYAWWHNGFRKSSKKIFNWKWCQSNNFGNEISDLRNVGNRRKTSTLKNCGKAEIAKGENIPLS